MSMITTPDPIHLVQLRTLRAMISLEVEGMTRHGQSAVQIVRQRYGIKKRRKIDVYFEFCRLTNQEPSQKMISRKAELTAHRKGNNS